MLELADVLCQAEGITLPGPSVAGEGSKGAHYRSPGGGGGGGGLAAALKNLLKIGITRSDSTGSKGSKGTTITTTTTVPGRSEVVGFVPPRREIGMS